MCELLYWVWLTLYRKIISGVGYTLVDGSLSGLLGWKNPTCGFYNSFCNMFLDQNSFGIDHYVKEL